MAVAEFPAHPIALPRRSNRAASASGAVPNLAWIPLVGVLLGIASLFYVAQTGEVAVAGYDIQALQSELDDWQMRNEQLSLDLARARALPAIEAQATGRLLMVPARDPIFLKSAASEGGRTDMSSRGVSSPLPALERPGRPPADPLDPVRSSVSMLIPRAQAASR